MVVRSCSTALGDGIRITSLEVPETVDMGEDATLKCCYDLASHDLYSVKWYRDDEEFFRYMPSESPPMATQELNGVSVSKDQSNGDMIVLKNVELNSSGRYKCEVISDAPEFHTADKSAEMMVVVVPEEKPLIHGTQHEYHIGDFARLTCTSARSLPPAQLTWQINGKQAPPEYLLSLPTISFPDGLAQTKLQLKFLVARSHFNHGEMTLRCSARISTLYYKTQQHSVDGQFNYNVPVMESRDISALSSDQGKARRAKVLALSGSSSIRLPSHSLMTDVSPILSSGSWALIVGSARREDVQGMSFYSAWMNVTGQFCLRQRSSEFTLDTLGVMVKVNSGIGRDARSSLTKPLAKSSCSSGRLPSYSIMDDESPACPPAPGL
ncbi:uncharacterized protein [Palaemon carinicauda]|uniref:uncharacterized protein n=1 Tax=Palaemon carinicauda TaxID=392227 RepID=UPI0035B63515